METIRKSVTRVPVVLSVPSGELRLVPRIEEQARPRERVYVWRSLTLRPDEFVDIVAAGRRKPAINRGR